MAAQPKIYVMPQEYLTIERQAKYKSEYSDGQIFAMSGASKQHNLIVANVLGELHAQLKKRPCTVYPSDMRLKVSPTGLYTYPDVSVVCGEAEFDDDHQDTLLNPTLIVEVLSKSTEAYDRGEKFEQYRKLASLAEYILIAQDKYHVEHYVRQANHQWLLSEANRLQETIQLPSIGCELALVDIYAKVKIIVK